MKLSKRQLCLAALSSLLIVGAFACGQNPNITREEHPEAAPPPNLAAAPGPMESSGSVPGGPLQTPTNPGELTTANPAPAQGANPQPAAPVPVAPQPVVTVTPGPSSGPQGPQGPRGERDCTGPQRMERSSKDLTVQERTALPYKTTNRHIIRFKNVGESSGKKDGEKFVIDSQVGFKFVLENLPPRASIKDARVAVLLDITKVPMDTYKDTEIMCLINERICSGELYKVSEGDWRNNINWDFFKKSMKGPINKYFTEQYLNAPVRSGSSEIYSKDVTIELADFLVDEKGHRVLDVLDVLYGNTPMDKSVKKKTLRFMVADDTFVKSAKLVFEYTRISCAGDTSQGAGHGNAESSAEDGTEAQMQEFEIE